MATVVINYKVDSKQVAKADKQLTKLDKENKDVQKSTKKVTKAADEQSKAYAGLTDKLTAVGNRFTIAGKGLGDMAAGMATSTKATGGLSVAMRVLKFAIASTGIGLLVVGLASLVSFFTKTQRGADVLSKAMAAMGAVVSVITDRLSAFGETLFNAFSNPQKTIKEFGETIKNFVLERVRLTVEGLGLLGKAIGQVFERDFKGAFETAKEGAISLAKGIDPLTIVMSKIIEVAPGVIASFKDITNEMINEANAAAALEARQQALEKNAIRLSVLNAERKAEIADLILISREETNTSEEQLAAVLKAQEIRKKITSDNLLQQFEVVKVLREQQALGENLIEDDRELAAQEVELLRLRKEGADTLRELVNREITLNATIKAQRKKDFDSEIAQIQEKAAALADAEEQQTRKEADELETRIQNRNETIIKAGEFLTNFNIKEKLVALQKAKINISEGITKALAAAPPPFNLILAGITAAAGAASIAAIVGTKIPSFGEGGEITGKSHGDGGTLINAEGGEFVMSRKSVKKIGLENLKLMNEGVTVVNDQLPIAEAIAKQPKVTINMDEQGFEVRMQRMTSTRIARQSRYSF